MVDAKDLKSFEAIHAGSSPALGTNLTYPPLPAWQATTDRPS